MRNSAATETPFALWTPVILYAALIYFLSSNSFHFPWFQRTQNVHGDWLVHVVEYSIFGALVCRALSRQSFFNRSARRLFIAVVLTGVLYGASDEFHQRYVSNRDSSLSDVVADTVGAALGAWIWLMKTRKNHA
jgi:VanZ family protein